MKDPKQFLSVGMLIGGAVVIYAGVTGYHVSDALRVLVGKKPIGQKRAAFGTVTGTPTPGATVGQAPTGYTWQNGWLVSTDPSKYPDISHTDTRYRTAPSGQRYIAWSDGDYYDNTSTHPGGTVAPVAPAPANYTTAVNL